MHDLTSIFCDKMTSDSLVMWMRFITAGYIKENSFLYENFLEMG